VTSAWLSTTRDGSRLDRSALADSAVRSAVLAAIYFVVGRASLELASLHQSASPVWPPTGIALAAILLYGARIWPGVFAGAFLVNLDTLGNVATSFGIAAGNTLEALVGAFLVERFARGTAAFDRASDVLRFVFVAGLAAPVVSATVGVATLTLGGLADSARFGPIWITWWFGDLVGAVVVAPLILIWARSGAPRWDARRMGETALMLAVVLYVSAVVFGDTLPEPFNRYPTAYLCFPPLLWPVFRLGHRGTVLAVFALAAVGLVGTLRGHGPFAQHDLNDSLLLLQGFLATISVMNLLLAALVSERRLVERDLGRSRREVEAQAVEIEELYRTAPVGLCLLDRDLRFVRINAWLAAINGRPPAELLGRSVREVVPDLADRLEPLMRKVIETGEPVRNVEISGTTEASPGTERYWLESYHPLRGASGDVIGINGVVQEVTSMRLAEEAVRRSERELNDLFENASQGIEWVGANGTILRANRAGLRMLGYSAAEYVGRNVREFHASPEVAALVAGRIARGERLEEFPALLRAKDGTLRDVVIDSSAYREIGGAPRAQLFIRDVTDRKQAEAELAAWHHELERRVEERTAELALAQRRLQAEADARKRLEAEVAAAVESEQLRLGQELHEGLGQELTGIAYLMAALHRALRGASSTQAMEAMRLEEMITRSIERTRSLAKAFYPVEMERLGLLAALEEISYNTRTSFGVDCIVHLQEGSLAADLRGPVAIQLFRIAQEAVLNAVKHGNARRIDVDVTSDDGTIVMTLEDDGTGLPASIETIEGTGLRLMRYRAGIVGGALEVTSSSSGGALVRCWAPLPVAGGREVPLELGC
jgi:PAS domain S-box-containing protein